MWVSVGQLSWYRDSWGRGGLGCCMESISALCCEVRRVQSCVRAGWVPPEEIRRFNASKIFLSEVGRISSELWSVKNSADILVDEPRASDAAGGLPRRIGLIFMVYKAPADRISVRDRAAFCFFLFLPGGKRGQRDTGLTLGVWNRFLKIWALLEIRAKPVFVWRKCLIAAIDGIWYNNFVYLKIV